MHLASDEYMHQLSERVFWDRCEDFTGRPLSKEDVMASRAAKSKSWFGIIEAFEALSHDWSILEEIMQVINGTSPLDGESDPLDAAQPAQPAEDEPLDRKAFQLLRDSYDSTGKMIQAFLNDHEHHVRVRMLCLAGRALQTEYAAGLEDQSEGQHAMVAFQVERSKGAWFQTVIRLMKLLDSGETFKRLDLRPHYGVGAAVEPDAVQKDSSRCISFVNLLVELAHARVWSQLHHSLCFPNVLVRVLETSPKKDETQAFLRRAAFAVKAALLAFDKYPTVTDIKDLVYDLGTTSWVLTRELLADGAKVSWDPSQLKQLAWSVFAGPAETKSCCEAPFGWLSDSVRQTKANFMTGYTKYAFLQEFESLKVLSEKAYTLPFDNINANSLARWRPAGYHAQRRAAAAMSFVMAYSTAATGLNLQALSECWAGCLLLKG
eukprot:s1804_g5.t1